MAQIVVRDLRKSFQLAARRWRRGAILLGLAVGWWMGGYQMLKGAHYLSHTLFTMTLAWVVMLGWSRVLRPPTADS